MLIVIPLSFSSGALSILSNALKLARPLSARTFVIADVKVVLPWSTWPIVPIFKCSLFLTNSGILIFLSVNKLLFATK